MPSPADAPLQLTLETRLDALGPARRAVLDHLAPCVLSPRTVYAIELILEETFMNAMLHGFADATPHRVDLRVETRPDAVVMHFEDDGVEFDPTRSREPRLGQSLEEATPGGRGVVLVRRFARAVRYRREQGRNMLSIEVARDAG